MNISGSIEPITEIWVSLERSFPPTEVEYILMPNLVKGVDIRNGRKGEGSSRPARKSMG